MKFRDILKCLFPAFIFFTATTLEHEKSFLMQENAASVWSVAIYEDSLLLTSSNDIVQKDIQNGAVQRTFRAHKNTIYSFIVTKDSRMISSAYDDMIIVWSLETGSILKRIRLRSSDTLIKSMSFRDEQVFTSGLDMQVRLIDLESGKVVRTTSVNSAIYCVAASEDFLFVGKNLPPFGLKLNIASGAIIKSLDGHADGIFSLFLWDSLLFSGSFDTTIISWSIVNDEIIQKYIGHAGVVLSMAVFDGELYSSGHGREFFKWNISNGLIIKKYPVVHINEARTFVIRSKDIFTGSMDTTVIRRDAISGDILFLYSGRNSKIRSVVSWNGFIISGGEEQIRMWDASTNSLDPLAVLDYNIATINVLYSFEDHIFFGTSNGYVEVLSLTSLTLIKTFSGNFDPLLLNLIVPGDFTPTLAAKGLSLYGGGSFGSIYHWNMSSGMETALFSAHSAQIMSLKLNDEVLYSGSWDNTIKVWNTKSMENDRVLAAFSQVFAILIENESIIACILNGVEMFSLISGKRNVLLEVSRGNMAYTGHEDSLIRVRNLYTLVPYETYSGHLDVVSSLCFDEVFNLYSAGFDGTVKKWNMAFRRVAFSFENRNDSVASLAAYQSQLFVGLKSGRIDCYHTDDAMSLKSLKFHRKAISSLIAFDDFVISSGFDGLILQFSSQSDGDFTTIYKTDPEPLKHLSLGSSFWIALQGDSKIIISPINISSNLISEIESQTPLGCVAATVSVILAGSKSGIIYAWDIEKSQPVLELKGHVSPVNNLLFVDDRLFSASDDKTIIEWSLESRATSRSYKRVSATALGHLGPVNSLSYCSDTLFSAGSDLAVRRWSTKTGKHDDVYFGFTKSVTAVLCYNGSVFAGSEDFSVLMFKPSLPQSKDATVNPSTTILKRNTKQGKIVRLHRAEGSSVNVTQIAVLLTAVVVVITILIFGFICYTKRAKKNVFQTELAVASLEKLSAQTVLDLATVVNSVMGISKHAAYRMDNSVLAKIKRLTAGGGGELFLAKIMDASLRNKIGEVVIQKVVFKKNTLMEEAFYQEVGIMILLNSFPHFCTILGYTEKPLSIVLKYYPEGSLYEWIRKTDTTKRLALKIVKELSGALNVMHSHFLAHCDIKPQNVLVQVENGIPSCFLTDFGITQVLSDQIVATKTFKVINLRGLSVHYSAPESFSYFRSKSYTGADFKKYDIYSLACVFYELLLQKGPWDYFLMENN